MIKFYKEALEAVEKINEELFEKYSKLDKKDDYTDCLKTKCSSLVTFGALAREGLMFINSTFVLSFSVLQRLNGSASNPFPRQCYVM